MARTLEGTQLVSADSCELCGTRVGDARERARHLRRAHPDYARNVIARMAAPFAFIASVVVLSAVHAPPVAYLVAMAAAYAVSFFGRVGSRKARTRAGARPSIGVKRMSREGGLRFVLLVPAVVLIMFVLQRLG